MVRGIRGATTVEHNDAMEIGEATKELLKTIISENELRLEDVVSAIFTVTTDLNACFPATSARELGWELIPLMCMTEIPVPDSLPRCIRVLIHVNTTRRQTEIAHVYLRNAKVLRKDLAKD